MGSKWDPGLEDGDEHQESIKDQPEVSETVASGSSGIPTGRPTGLPTGVDWVDG